MIGDDVPADLEPTDVPAYRAGVVVAHAVDHDLAAVELELSLLDIDELRAVARHLAVIVAREVSL